MSRLVIVSRVIDGATFTAIDARATAIVLGPSALSGAGSRLVEFIVARRAFVLAIGAGEMKGHPLAAGLFADVFALARNATVYLAGVKGRGDVAAGTVSRIGRRALRLLVEEASFTGTSAVDSGLADLLVPEGADPLEWVARWLGGRSLLALQSAARLVRLRGGDLAERMEFSRLFAAGEPQEGIGKFLAKAPLDFSERRIVETI